MIEKKLARVCWRVSPAERASVSKTCRQSLIAHAPPNLGGNRATQARDPAPHYQHSEIGDNYRQSNVLAATGRGQLRVLDERVRRKREIFESYRRALGDLPGIDFMPEAPWGRHNRWPACSRQAHGDHH